MKQVMSGKKKNQKKIPKKVVSEFL